MAQTASTPATTGNAPAASTAAAGTSGQPGTTAAKRTYRMIHMGVGKANQSRIDALSAIAKRLNCTVQRLIWEGVDRVIKDPPTVAPAGSVARDGGSSGFFTVPTTGPDGRATGFSVVEVAKRSDIQNGHQWFRYDEAKDPKTRGRAYRAAYKAAEASCRLAGLDASKITSTFLPGKDKLTPTV